MHIAVDEHNHHILCEVLPRKILHKQWVILNDNVVLYPQKWLDEDKGWVVVVVQKRK